MSQPIRPASLGQLTRDDVRNLADSDQIFRRGEQYLHTGMILRYAEAGGAVTAQVRGSLGAYHVAVSMTDARLLTSCTCPYEGDVCKHVVAVLLHCAETHAAPAAPARGPIRLDGYSREALQALAANLPKRQRVPAQTPRPGARPVAAASTLLETFRATGSLAPMLVRARYGVAQAGKALFRHGHARIEYCDAQYALVHVDEASARYQVTLRHTNGTLRGIEFICSCLAGQREPTLRCAHMVAAAYAMQDEARPTDARFAAPEDPTAHWEERLAGVLTARSTPRARKPRTLLAFSLQEGYSGGWKLTPYTVPVGVVDEALLGDRLATQQALSRLAAAYEIREVSYYGQPPANLLYGTPEQANLARIVAMANLYHAGNPLALALPQLGDALLFWRDSQAASGHPFAHPVLELDITPRALRLSLETEAAGSRLLPALQEGEELLPLAPETTHVLSHDPLWLLVGDRVLRAEGDGTLLGSLLQTRDIVIPAAAKQTFVSRYLPKLLDRAVVAGKEVALQEEVATTPVSRLYLSEAQGAIVAELVFCYAGYEAPLDTSWPSTALQHDEARDMIVAIRRDTDAEEAAWRAISQYGLKRDGDRFVLRQRVSPVDFLLRELPKLQADGIEVFGEEAITSTRVNRHQPMMRLSVSSDIDWFDVKAIVSYGDQEVSFAEIRKAIKGRRGYVKLPDGSMGMLPQEWLNRYRHLFALGEATAEGVRLSATQASLLELSLQEAEGAQVDEITTQRLAHLHAFTAIEQRPLPSGFQGELRPYQQTGYDWLHFLHDYGFGGCLADDMGIGKTVQALVFLQSLYASGHATTASLIVMPRSLLDNWAREAARFTPDLKVLIHADGDRDEDHASFDGYHLVLTTYGVMLRDVKLFRQYRFHYLVLDEAQAIKNAAAQTARAARLLQGDHRLALTGTPVENSTEELWSLFAFLNPGHLGTQEAFREHFVVPVQRNGDAEATAMLRALVYPFILRRTKDQVAPELPPRTERMIYCEMTTAQRKLYQRTRDRYRAELLGLIDRDGMSQARFKVLEGLLRLRQLANDPRLVDAEFSGMSSKFEAVLESLEVLRDEGHKALVFSQFTSMLALLRASLDARGWPYLYLDGKTRHRQQIVDRFQDDASIPFFLISLKAGGLGLNLTAADYVLHIDPWWNPAVEQQATDRTHRIGQQRPVMIYKFIAEETVEEKILQLQERKQQLVSQLITAESGFMKSLTRDDIAALFT